MSGQEKEVITLILVDQSGSMAGEAISKVNLQSTEILFALKDAQEASDYNIHLGIMTFHESQQWFVSLTPVRDLPNLPGMITPAYEIINNKFRIGKKSDYVSMLNVLDHYLTDTLSQDDQTIQKVKILLFTDGYPTDERRSLETAVEKLKKNPFFSKNRTDVYVVLESEGKMTSSFFESLTGDKNNIISADRISNLISIITDDMDQDSDLSWFE